MYIYINQLFYLFLFGLQNKKQYPCLPGCANHCFGLFNKMYLFCWSKYEIMTFMVWSQLIKLIVNNEDKFTCNVVSIANQLNQKLMLSSTIGHKKMTQILVLSSTICHIILYINTGDKKYSSWYDLNCIKISSEFDRSAHMLECTWEKLLPMLEKFVLTVEVSIHV